jgi:Cofactor assembly of complex C subunit B
MRLLVLVALLATCLTVAHAFAPRQPTVVVVTSSRRLNNAMSSSHVLLHLIDPMAVHHSMETIVSATTTSPWLADAASMVTPPAPTAFLDAPPEAGGISYSQTSYYTILALYTLSFPGLWSTIKRSTTAKVKRMTFVTPGENAAVVIKSDSDGKPKSGLSLRQQAGEIMACT